MITFDISPLDERFADRQCSGDEFDAERYFRATAQLDELGAVDLCAYSDDCDEDHVAAAAH